MLQWTTFTVSLLDIVTVSGPENDWTSSAGIQEQFMPERLLKYFRIKWRAGSRVGLLSSFLKGNFAKNHQKQAMIF